MGDFSNCRVLIVDDDRDFAAPLSALLQNRGYAVETAVDAAGAVAAIGRFAAGIALIELRLGGGDDPSGIDLIAELRRRQPDMICVVMAAFAELDTVVEALRARADDFLTKPLHPPMLFATLECCLATRKRLRESEQRFRDITEASSDWFWEMDGNLRFSYFSDRFTEITGVPQAALLGKTREETGIPDIDPEIWQSHLADLTAHRSFRDFHHRRILPDGRHVHLSVNGKAIFDEEGSFIGYRGTGSDITERKRAERELSESEERLRMFFDNSPGAISLKGVDGRYTLINPSFENILGVTRDETIGKRTEEIFSGPFSASGMAHDRAVMESAEAVTREEEFDHAGRCKSFLTVKFPITDGNGEVTEIGAIHIEVTARKQAEKALQKAHDELERRVEERTEELLSTNTQLVQEIADRTRAEIALRDSEARYREIFDESPVGVWEDDWSDVKRMLDELVAGGVTDLRRYFDDNPHKLRDAYDVAKIVNISRATYEMYGAPSKQALIDSNRAELETIEVLDGFRDSMIAFMAGETGFAFESPDHRIDGTPIVTSSHLVIPPQFSHDWSRVIYTIEDITERKRTEEALRESEATLSALVNHFPAEIYFKDTDGRYRLVNQIFEQRYGMALDKVAGKTVSDFFPKDVADRSTASFRKVLETNDPVTFEERIHFGGSDRINQMTHFPVLGLEGEVLGIGGIGIDITERKRADLALRESEARLRAVIDNFPTSIFLKDLEGRFSLIDKRFEEWYGLSTEDVIGKTSYDIYEKSVADAYVAQDKEVLETLSVIEQERDVKRANGDIRRHIITKFPVLDVDGQAIGVGTFDIDITERKRAEDALRRSEERFRELLESAPDAMVIVNRQGEIVLVNKQTEAVFGYPRDELVGRPVECLISPDLRKKHVNLRAGFYADPQIRPMGLTSELQGVARDGREFPVEVSLSPIQTDEGVLVAATVRDVTERKQAEEALRESDDRYARAVAGTNDGIWDWNVRTGANYFSPRCEAILGYGEGELEPHVDTFKDLTHPDELTLVMEAVKAHLEDKIPYDLEFRMRHKDGGYVWIHSRGQATWDDDGKPLRMAGSIADITKRRAAEEGLQDSQARMIDAIESFPGGFVLYDAEERLVLCNSKYREFYPSIAELLKPGARLEEVARISFEAGDVMGSAENVEAWVKLRLEHNRTGQGTHEQQLKDGRWLLCSERKTSDGGTVGIRTDITEVKEVQAQLLQAQKMEAVGQLTGGIAHDFNNLLAIVMGNLELIEDEIEDGGSLSDYLRAAFSASDDAAKLTQRLLAFSRTQPLMPRVADMNAMVTKLIGLVGRTLDDAIVIKTTFDDELAPVFIDASQFENALLNLMVNASHAMPRGGEIYIQTKGLTVGEETAAGDSDLPPGDYISLTVRDTGDGMSRDVLEHVFEPFFTTKEVGEGSGLGLSMVFGFVKQSGGHVTIDSEEGQGTTVTLYLPTTTVELSEDVKPPLCSDVRGGGEMILYVEDDQRVLDVIVDHLTGMGYKVQHARDGKSALHAIDEIPVIDLLLTDVILPGGMNGAELALEARRKLPALPVLYASGYSAAALMKTGHLDDNAQLIEKPFTRRELAAKIAAMLS